MLIKFRKSKSLLRFVLWIPIELIKDFNAWSLTQIDEETFARITHPMPQKSLLL